MKWLKRIGLGLLAMIALLAVVGLFLPARLEVEVTETIDAPVWAVYPLVADLRAFAQWEPWSDRDPSQKNTLGETTAGVGGTMSWTGKDGPGRMTITEVEPGRRVVTELAFGEPGEEMKAESYFNLVAVGQKTKMTWGMKSDATSNPFWRWMSVIFKGTVRSDYQAGIKKLAVLAAQAPLAQLYLEIKTREAIRYIAIRDTLASKAEMEEFFAGSYAQLMQATGPGGGPAGPAAALYYHYSDSRVDLAAILPVNAAVGDKIGPYIVHQLPAQKSVYALHVGPYETMMETYNAIETLAGARGLPLGGPSVELYETDPGMEPDSSKWKTAIYVPIAAASKKDV